MKFPDDGVRFPVNLDAKHYSPPRAELDKMRAGLDPLLKAVDHFPVAALHIVLERFPRDSTFRVKLSLALTGATLVSREDGERVHAAFERCVDNLLEDVYAYKARMGNESEIQKLEKGTHKDLQPDLEPDLAEMEAAVKAGDYTAFRKATIGYEEPLRKRVGRWVERYPAVNARIGKDLQINDLVEEVFLDAFGAYGRRPRHVRFGDWLAHFIDPAIKEIANGRNGELDNARFAESAVEAEMEE